MIVMSLAMAANASVVEPFNVTKEPGYQDLCDYCGGEYYSVRAEGITVGTNTVSDGNVSLTFEVYSADGQNPESAMNWTLNTAGYKIMGVGVMDGVDGGNIYCYESLGGLTSDNFLTTPGPTQGPYTFKDISHIDFCYIVYENGNGGGQEIPEFPTVALPVAAIIGLAFLFQGRKEE